MAQFKKALSLWGVQAHTELMSGDMVLQCGQWLDLNGSGKEFSRYISHDKDTGYINAVHYPKAQNVKIFRLRAVLDKAKKGKELNEEQKQFLTENGYGRTIKQG